MLSALRRQQHGVLRDRFPCADCWARASNGGAAWTGERHVCPTVLLVRISRTGPITPGEMDAAAGAQQTGHEATRAPRGRRCWLNTPPNCIVGNLQTGNCLQEEFVSSHASAAGQLGSFALSRAALAHGRVGPSRLHAGHRRRTVAASAGHQVMQAAEADDSQGL